MSIQNQNEKIVIDFLRQRKILAPHEYELTKYNGGYWDGKRIDFVKLIAELLKKNQNV